MGDAGLEWKLQSGEFVSDDYTRRDAGRINESGSAPRVLILSHVSIIRVSITTMRHQKNGIAWSTIHGPNAHWYDENTQHSLELGQLMTGFGARDKSFLELQ